MGQQGSSGLHSKPSRYAGHKEALTREVDTFEYFISGGCGGERRGHVQPSRIAGAWWAQNWGGPVARIHPSLGLRPHQFLAFCCQLNGRRSPQVAAASGTNVPFWTSRNHWHLDGSPLGVSPWANETGAMLSPAPS